MSNVQRTGEGRVVKITNEIDDQVRRRAEEEDGGGND